MILTAKRHHAASPFRVVTPLFAIRLTVMTLLIFFHPTARANSPQVTSAPGASQTS
jgi:hypothetical protein